MTEAIPDQVEIIADFLADLNKSDNPVEFWFDAQNLWERLEKVAVLSRPIVGAYPAGGGMIIVAFGDGSSCTVPDLCQPTAYVTIPSTSTGCTSSAAGYYTTTGGTTGTVKWSK